MTNMIGTFGGMRSKMQSLSKMMKAGGGGGVQAYQIPLNTARYVGGVRP